MNQQPQFKRPGALLTELSISSTMSTVFLFRKYSLMKLLQQCFLKKDETSPTMFFSRRDSLSGILNSHRDRVQTIPRHHEQEEEREESYKSSSHPRQGRAENV